MGEALWDERMSSFSCLHCLDVWHPPGLTFLGFIIIMAHLLGMCTYLVHEYMWDSWCALMQGEKVWVIYRERNFVHSWRYLGLIRWNKEEGLTGQFSCIMNNWPLCWVEWMQGVKWNDSEVCARQINWMWKLSHVHCNIFYLMGMTNC